MAGASRFHPIRLCALQCVYLSDPLCLVVVSQVVSPPGLPVGGSRDLGVSFRGGTGFVSVVDWACRRATRVARYDLAGGVDGRGSERGHAGRMLKLQ